MTTREHDHERYYRPRPEWVWDSRSNPELRGVARLRVRVSGPPVGVLLAVVSAWAGRYEEEAPGVYLAGGAAVEIIGGGECNLDLLLVSGGQDALESLDGVVLDLHAGVLREHPKIDVSWLEMPITGG